MNKNYFYADAGIKTFCWIVAKPGEQPYQEEINAFFRSLDISLTELREIVITKKQGLERSLFAGRKGITETEINWFMVGVKVALLSNVAHNLDKYAEPEQTYRRAEWQCIIELDKAGVEAGEKEKLKGLFEDLKEAGTDDAKAEIIEKINQALIWISENDVPATGEPVLTEEGLFKQEKEEKEQFDKLVRELKSNDPGKRKDEIIKNLGHLSKKLETYNKFSRTDAEGSSAPAEQDARPEVYFSYSSANYSIVSPLCNGLEKEGFLVKQYKKDLEYKGSISEFAGKIAKARFIVVIISDDYFQSPYCMKEINEVWKKSGAEEDAFIGKIFPIRIKGFDMENLPRFFSAWKNKCTEKEERIRENLPDIGIKEFEDYCQLRDIRRNASDIAAMIADVNILADHELETNNYNVIIDAIKKGAA